MRTLIYVPIIHTSADLGSMAKDVTKRGIASLGEETWTKHQNTIEGFWDTIARYFDSIDVAGMKIYQDGMVADGQMGQRIVEETSKAGSKNYQLVSNLLKRGAVLVKTEDFKLVKEEYNKLLAITQAKSVAGKIAAFLRYKLIKSRLLKKRDVFIAERIDQTLEPGEHGIVFIGASHRVKERLPKSILITDLKDREKVRTYQKLLTFPDKYKVQFDRLGQYLVSRIDSQAGADRPDLDAKYPPS